MFEPEGYNESPQPKKGYCIRREQLGDATAGAKPLATRCESQRKSLLSLYMFKRSLNLSQSEDNFFLWGPRQTGKSTLLRAAFPQARVVDLLQSDQFIRYRTEPHLLRQELLAAAPRNGSGSPALIVPGRSR